MELWDRFRTLFRIMRRSGLPALVPPRLASDSTAGTGDPDGTGQVLVQRYELNGRLQTLLLERAGREARPAQELQEPLSAAELEQLKTADKLKKLWDRLPDRQKEVTALTCLGYTNRQMAARLKISVNTIQGYVKQALIQYQLHSKAELRNLLEEWDFSDWAPRAD